MVATYIVFGDVSLSFAQRQMEGIDVYDLMLVWRELYRRAHVCLTPHNESVDFTVEPLLMMMVMLANVVCSSSSAFMNTCQRQSTPGQRLGYPLDRRVLGYVISNGCK